MSVDIFIDKVLDATAESTQQLTQKYVSKISTASCCVLISKDAADATDAIIGFHAFTGFDTVSAFWRKGKRRPWSLVMKETSFTKLFEKLRTDWEVEDDSIITDFESFVCSMYGSRTCQSVNSMRCVFCNQIS